MKTGLVLEGGAMRGIYTAGVLDVLYENNIFTDGVAGVSAGSIHACSYLSSQPGRSIRYYMKYSRDWRFISFRSLFLTGDLVNEEFCYHTIPELLDPFDNDTFEKNIQGIDFYAVASDLETGKAVYQPITTLRGEAVNRIKASASMPLVSRIVKIDGQKLLDGGVCDSIPLKAMEDMGYGKNIVVLTQPADYEKKPAKMGLAKRMYRDYPLFLEAMASRHTHYNETLKYVAASVEAKKALVIQPSRDLHIGRMEHDKGRIKAQYELGRQDALKKLEEVREFLKES